GGEGGWREGYTERERSLMDKAFKAGLAGSGFLLEPPSLLPRETSANAAASGTAADGGREGGAAEGGRGGKLEPSKGQAGKGRVTKEEQSEGSGSSDVGGVDENGGVANDGDTTEAGGVEGGMSILSPEDFDFDPLTLSDALAGLGMDGGGGTQGGEAEQQTPKSSRPGQTLAPPSPSEAPLGLPSPLSTPAPPSPLRVMAAQSPLGDVAAPPSPTGMAPPYCSSVGVGGGGGGSDLVDSELVEAWGGIEDDPTMKELYKSLDNIGESLFNSTQLDGDPDPESAFRLGFDFDETAASGKADGVGFLPAPLPPSPPRCHLRAAAMGGSGTSPGASAHVATGLRKGAPERRHVVSPRDVCAMDRDQTEDTGKEGQGQGRGQ
ncbi:unnamed protein product, partial [Discosporangium mesarthrocarpum]